MLLRWRKLQAESGRPLGLLAFAAACAFGCGSASAQHADPFFGNGYEGYAPARLIVHYPAGAYFMRFPGAMQFVLGPRD